VASTICGPNFYCNSRSNGKTQPLHWLAIDPTTNIGHRGTKTKKKRGKITNKGAWKELLTYDTRSKVD